MKKIIHQSIAHEDAEKVKMEDWPEDDIDLFGPGDDDWGDTGVTVTVSCLHCGFRKSATYYETYTADATTGRLIAEHTQTGCTHEPNVRDPYAAACERIAGDHTADLEYQAARGEANAALEEFRACASNDERRAFLNSLGKASFFWDYASMTVEERQFIVDAGF